MKCEPSEYLTNFHQKKCPTKEERHWLRRRNAIVFVVWA